MKGIMPIDKESSNTLLSQAGTIDINIIMAFAEKLNKRSLKDDNPQDAPPKKNNSEQFFKEYYDKPSKKFYKKKLSLDEKEIIRDLFLDGHTTKYLHELIDKKVPHSTVMRICSQIIVHKKKRQGEKK